MDFWTGGCEEYSAVWGADDKNHGAENVSSNIMCHGQKLGYPPVIKRGNGTPTTYR